MARIQARSAESIEKGLKPGWCLHWHHQVYRVLAVDPINPFIIHVENCATSEPSMLRMEDLLLADGGREGPPLFAPTLERLQKEIESLKPPPDLAPTSGIPQALLEKADRIIYVVETVERMVAERESRATLRGEKLQHTTALGWACSMLDDPVRLTAYYKYRRCYRQHNGDRVSIAVSLRRATYKKMKMDKAQLHFIDTLILRYYARSRPTTPLTLYRVAESVIKRTNSFWVDPDKCGKLIPENLVEELLDHRLPIKAILDNAEKRRLLTHIELPSRAWFYQYLHWFEAQPEHGKAVVIARHGKEAWEREHMVFDTFVHRAAQPLQYVFADHYLLDVFIVDEATRSRIDRLWLTVLIDAYSRCILGMALLYETPCIESIQNALLHAIWPKKSHAELGIVGDWACYGIPQQLYLDNAWAHHSHSLEDLARAVSHGGKYDTIDLVFRPPYKGRYGALIERFFGNLSGQIKQSLPGAILSSDPKHVRDAAKQACLLYDDIYRFVQQMIVDYQNSPHSELEGMTPHEKWCEGMRSGINLVPPLTDRVRRLFLRKSPETRVITRKGISVFGLHYWSPDLSGAEHVDKNGKRIEYSFRYDPSDISTITLYRGEIWIGDLRAKELRLADGSLKHISLWEREMAKDLAQDFSTGRRDWLAYVNEIDELSKRRTGEKKKAHQKLKRPVQGSSSSVDVQAMEKATSGGSKTDSEYTRLLANFLKMDSN